jgi:UMF1 family MFS transporter
MSERSALPGRGARLAWAFFDWAAQPFFTLVATFVFAPYFVSALATDAVSGQAMWGYATGAAGLIIALFAPVLGAIADAGGPRKPWIVAFGGLLMAGSGLLWWAAPGATIAVPLALTGLIIALIGAEFATVFNNAMMPTLAPPDHIGRLSGAGWALGYAGGLVSLALTLVFLAAQSETGRTIAGLAPAFGLDPATREGDRIVGPLAALWFALFVLPMLLVVPDVPRHRPLRQAISNGLAALRRSLRAMPQQPALLRFLIANMLSQDALVALFAFGGIYAAGVFGWTTVEIGIFGILLTVAGTAGALLGGRLDDRVGAQQVVLASLLVLMLCCLGIYGTDRDTTLFLWPTAPPVQGDGLYAATSERVYLALGLLIGAVAGPVQAAARSLLVRLSPPEAVGQNFGLLALSGKITSFIGPTLVAVATQLTGRQQTGALVLIVMFALAVIVLSTVRMPAHDNGSGGAAP